MLNPWFYLHGYLKIKKFENENIAFHKNQENKDIIHLTLSTIALPGFDQKYSRIVEYRRKT